MQANENAPVKGNKQTPSALRKERWKTIIVRLYLEGNNQERIRELARVETGGHTFSRAVVGQYVAEAIAEWQISKAQFIDHQKSIELAKINNLENEYWEAWRRSCKDQKTISQEKTPSKKPQGEEAKRQAFSISKVTASKRKTTGDAKFLEGVQWCVEMRCKILGIETGPAIPPPTPGANTTNVYVRKINFVLKPPIPLVKVAG